MVSPMCIPVETGVSKGILVVMLLLDRRNQAVLTALLMAPRAAGPGPGAWLAPLRSASLGSGTTGLNEASLGTEGQAPRGGCSCIP